MTLNIIIAKVCLDVCHSLGENDTYEIGLILLILFNIVSHTSEYYNYAVNYKDIV